MRMVCFYAFLLGAVITKIYYNLYDIDSVWDYLEAAACSGVCLFFVWGGIKDLEKEQVLKLDMICREKDKEIEQLKRGKEPFSVNGRVFYLTPEEASAHEKWMDFYFFKNSKKVGFVPDDIYDDIVYNGILEHKSNKEILNNLINWKKHLVD